MDLFIVVFTVIFLVFLGSGLYLTVLQELHKRSKGISVEYDSVQDIEKILKEKLDCSFVKDIEVGEKENIEFKCKYGIHTGIIKEGNFYIDKSLRKFSGHRDVEEAWYLEKFIKGIFYPKEAKDDLEIKFAKYIKIFNISRIIKYVVILCVAIWVFLLIGGMDSLKSKGVSQMCFADYSEEITIGEALQATCSNGKWSSNKIGDGTYHVTFSGYGANGSLLIILFQTNGSECSIKSITIDGEDITWMQGLFLEALYEGVADGNGVGDISGIDGEKTEESIPEINMEELNENDFEQKRENEDTYTEEDEFDEELYDSEVQDSSDDSIPVWDLAGHYEGIIGSQSYLDFSVYTDDSDDGSVGVADIYVEGGQYSYRAEIYEVSTNLYKAEVDTSENVMLSAYKDGDCFILQLYVDGECITEYLLVSQFQS